MNQLHHRILVVDDDPIVCASIQIILSVDNYASDVASNGEQALLKHRQNQYDLVITDFAMPGMKGDELATSLKEQFPRTPMILLSGAPPRDRPPGVDVTLLKPCSPSILLQSVGRLLMRQPRQE